MGVADGGADGIVFGVVVAVGGVVAVDLVEDAGGVATGVVCDGADPGFAGGREAVGVVVAVGDRCAAVGDLGGAVRVLAGRCQAPGGAACGVGVECVGGLLAGVSGVGEAFGLVVFGLF